MLSANIKQRITENKMLSANIKERINSTYAEYNDGTVELEARFGRKTSRGFRPGVSIQVFNRIKSHFDKMQKVYHLKQQII